MRNRLYQCLLISLMFMVPFSVQSAGVPVVHVGMVWLKEPGNIEHRTQVIEATRTLTAIPGVLEVRVGQPIASDRAIVDDSFDVGLIILLESEAALAAYLPHPIHQQVVKEQLLPLVEKILIYDFDDKP